MSDFSLLSKLPGSEREFIASTAEEIARKEGASSKEERLLALASHFKDQRVGCGEAVLAQKLARLPSEIQAQRYCGEEAIRNLLFLEHLGIPALLLTTNNFKDTGQGHDTVFLPDTRRILDWGELIGVRRNGKDLLSEKGKLLARDFTVSTPHFLSEELGRFTQRNLLDAFTSSPPHLIDRVEYPSGNIESSVHFNRADKKITIGQLVTDVTTNTPFYSDTTIISQTRGFVVTKSAGLAPIRKGIFCTKIPIFYSINGISVNEDFKNRLSEAEREAFILGMAYTIYSENGKKRVCSKGEVKEFLVFLEETSKKHPSLTARNEAQGHLDYYETLNQAYGARKAEKFLEALNFKIAFRSEHPNPEKYLLSSSLYKSFRNLGKTFIDRNTEILKQHYFTGTRNTPEQILVDHFGYQFKQRHSLSKLELN